MTTEPLTREHAERIARIAHVLIDAALKNKDVQYDMRDLMLPDGIRPTRASITANPPIRLEWQYATVIAQIGDAFAASRGKRWGDLIGVMPVEPDDPVDPRRVLYIYNAESPYNRRVEQRKWLKHRLGKGWRRLVQKAMRQTKRDFLRLLEDLRFGLPGATKIIRDRLSLTPGEFWRVARGAVLLDLPKKHVQMTLDFG